MEKMLEIGGSVECLCTGSDTRQEIVLFGDRMAVLDASSGNSGSSGVRRMIPYRVNPSLHVVACCIASASQKCVVTFSDSSVIVVAPDCEDATSLPRYKFSLQPVSLIDMGVLGVAMVQIDGSTIVLDAYQLEKSLEHAEAELGGESKSYANAYPNAMAFNSKSQTLFLCTSSSSSSSRVTVLDVAVAPMNGGSDSIPLSEALCTLELQGKVTYVASDDSSQTYVVCLHQADKSDVYRTKFVKLALTSGANMSSSSSSLSLLFERDFDADEVMWCDINGKWMWVVLRRESKLFLEGWDYGYGVQVQILQIPMKSEVRLVCGTLGGEKVRQQISSQSKTAPKKMKNKKDTDMDANRNSNVDFGLLYVRTPKGKDLDGGCVVYTTKPIPGQCCVLERWQAPIPTPIQPTLAYSLGGLKSAAAASGVTAEPPPLPSPGRDGDFGTYNGLPPSTNIDDDFKETLYVLSMTYQKAKLDSDYDIDTSQTQVTPLHWRTIRKAIRSGAVNISQHPFLLQLLMGRTAHNKSNSRPKDFTQPISTLSTRLEVVVAIARHSADLTEDVVTLLLGVCIAIDGDSNGNGDSSHGTGLTGLFIHGEEVLGTASIPSNIIVPTKKGRKRPKLSIDTNASPTQNPPLSPAPVVDRGAPFSSTLYLQILLTALLRRRLRLSPELLAGVFQRLGPTYSSIILRTLALLLQPNASPSLTALRTAASSRAFPIILTVGEQVLAVRWMQSLLDAHFSANCLALCAGRSSSAGVDTPGGDEQSGRRGERSLSAALIVQSISRAMELVTGARQAHRQTELVLGLCTHLDRMRERDSEGRVKDGSGIYAWAQPPQVYSTEILHLI